LSPTPYGLATLTFVAERQAGAEPAAHAVFAEPKHFQISWCHWATNTRLLCGLRAMSTVGRYVVPVTRLVAMDADGKNMRLLMQDSADTQGLFQDRIINWNPGST
jgi:hypothetical protein